MSTNAKSELSPEQALLLQNATEASAKLEAAILADEPQMRDFLREINAQLRQFPELLYLLTPENRSAIYRGLIKISEVEVVKATAKKAGKKNVLEDGSTVMSALSALGDLGL